MKIEELNIILKDNKTKEIKYEYSLENKWWYKDEYNKQNKLIYYESSSGYWHKRVYDEHGKEIYYENAYGIKHHY